MEQVKGLCQALLHGPSAERVCPFIIQVGMMSLQSRMSHVRKGHESVCIILRARATLCANLWFTPPCGVTVQASKSAGTVGRA